LVPENGSLGTDVISAESTLEAMSRAMVAHEARLGLDWRAAFWFDEAGPTSDALITTARVLQLLSQSDHPLSRLWAE
jgi:phosphomannomutase